MKDKFSSILLLSLYALVSIATSTGGYKWDPNDPNRPRRYGVASNCSNATLTNAEITIENSEIIDPPNTTFWDIGIPVLTLNIGDRAVGDLDAITVRVCDYSVDNSLPNTTISVYTCADNNVPACIVHLTHLD